MMRPVVKTTGLFVIKKYILTMIDNSSILLTRDMINNQC